MLTNTARGYLVELWARLVLRIKGYIPVVHRYRTPLGEIDLVAVHGDELVFIEVKYRRHKLDAHYALADEQRDRIARAAEFFREHHYVLSLKNYRFDEFVVWGWGVWTHLRNTSQMGKNPA